MIEGTATELPASDFLTATAHIPEMFGDDAAPGAAPVGDVLPPVEKYTAEYIGNLLGTPFALIPMFVKKGEFWPLSEQEKRQLGVVWQPILKPLLEKHPELDAVWVMAVVTTIPIITMRLAREKLRQAELTASTETAKFGDSPSSPAQPGAASPGRPIDLSVMPGESSSGFPPPSNSRQGDGPYFVSQAPSGGS